MARHEIRPRDAITVQKDTVSAASRQNGAVANFCRAEAEVGMPDVIETTPESRCPSVDQSSGGFPRTVVGNNDFEVDIRLARERALVRIERVLRVIGRNDDGNELVDGGPLPE